MVGASTSMILLFVGGAQYKSGTFILMRAQQVKESATKRDLPFLITIPFW